MKRMLYIQTYVCPYCEYEQQTMFPTEHYEAGSAGYRTYRCPRCNDVIEE